MFTALLLTLSLTMFAPSEDTNHSNLLEYYRDATVDALIAKPAAKTPAAIASREEDITRAALGVLVARGLAPSASNDASKLALQTIASLRTPIELQCAVVVLGGEGPVPNYIASDARVRKALFEALATEGDYGQRTLLQFAITGDDLIGQRAFDSLPTRISPVAERTLAGYIDGTLSRDRELFINRAAMIASAHASAALIPSLISAQYAPAKAKRGDEAWIAQGKSIAYVSGAVPIVGDGSGAFQPIVGSVFEGSVLRIMESVVVIYRTEVHYTLLAIVERETGMPPPPFGFDQERWAKWYADDFPQLARAQAERVAQQDELSKTKSTKSLDDA